MATKLCTTVTIPSESTTRKSRETIKDSMKKLVASAGIVREELFLELVQAIQGAIGNIAERQRLGQKPSEHVQHCLMRAAEEFILFITENRMINGDYITIEMVSKSFEDFMNELYRRASRTAVSNLEEMDPDKFKAMFGTCQTDWNNPKDVVKRVGEMYCFTHFLRYGGHATLNLQFRYDQFYTDHPPTILRDQGMSLILNDYYPCDMYCLVDLIPLESYCKGSQDLGDLLKAIGKVSLEGLKSILAIRHQFAFKMDGSLARLSISMLSNGSIYICGSTAGTSLYIFRVSKSRDIEVIKALVKEIVDKWYVAEGTPIIVGLLEAFQAFVSEALGNLKALSTITTYGEVVIPGSMPGSVGSNNGVPYFQLHDRAQIERYAKEHAVMNDQTAQRINDETIPQRLLELIEGILGVKFIKDATFADVLNICYGIMATSAFRSQKGSPKMDYTKFFLEVYGDLINSASMDFGKGDLAKNTDLLANALIYMLTPEEIKMPEGLISFARIDGEYFTFIKWKLMFWEFFHGASTLNQLPEMIKIFCYLNDLKQMMIGIDEALGDAEHLGTAKMTDRFRSMLDRTASFKMTYDFLEELSVKTNPTSNERETLDYILGAFRKASPAIKKCSGDILRGGLTAVLKLIELQFDCFRFGDGTMTIVMGDVEHTITGTPQYVGEVVAKWKANPNSLLEMTAFIDTMSKPNHAPTDALTELYQSKLNAMFTKYFGRWIERLSKKIPGEDPFFPILFDWDGTLNDPKHGYILEILKSFTNTTGIFVVILTGNQNVDMIKEELGRDSHFFEIFSIGKVLLEEMNLHPFLITAMTAQIKAWIMSTLRKLGLNVLLLDDSNAVFALCQRFGCNLEIDGDGNSDRGLKLAETGEQLDLIRANGNQSNILLMIGHWFMNVLQKNSEATLMGQWTYSEWLEIVVEWFNAVTYTFDRIDMGYLQFKDDRDYLNELAHVTVADHETRLIELLPSADSVSSGKSFVVVTGQQGTGKSFTASRLKLLLCQQRLKRCNLPFLDVLFGNAKDILSLNLDAYNAGTGEWTLEKQKKGETLLRRIINFFGALDSNDFAILLTRCTLLNKLSIAPSIILKTSNEIKCTPERFAQDVAKGRRRDVNHTDSSATHGVPPELQSETVFASFELPEEVGRRILELAEEAGLETRDNYDFGFDPKRGKPHYATANTQEQQRNFPRYLAGSLATVIGVAKFITTHGVTSMILLSYGNGQIGHTTLETGFVSGAQIHVYKLDTIIYEFVKLHTTPMVLVDVSVAPGARIQFVCLEHKQIKFEVVPYYHLRSKLNMN